MSDTRTFWDERFRAPGWTYGTEPNDFLREVAGSLRGPVLCIGEGEGRNAVFLAQRGLDVTAMDASPVGMAKAQKLASGRGVKLNTVVADLEDFSFGEARWGAIVSIWCHTPNSLRRRIHRDVVKALAPGGRYILEAYTPRQLAFGTGGPKSVELLCEPEDVRAELSGLTLERLEEKEREVHEGALHEGKSAVLQVVAVRPR
ncbi:MAG: class I SAM-dependent methyltransferase [Myxococcota bacterium]